MLVATKEGEEGGVCLGQPVRRFWVHRVEAKVVSEDGFKVRCRGEFNELFALFGGHGQRLFAHDMFTSGEHLLHHRVVQHVGTAR